MKRDLSHLILLFERHYARLKEDCCTLPQKPVDESLFDIYLFKPRPSCFSLTLLLNHHLDEIRHNIDRLRDTKEPLKWETFSYLSEKIANQLAAVSREIATHTLRVPVSERREETRHETHCRYIGYEKRLIEMKRHYQAKRDNVTSIAQQTQLNHQLATIEGRLYRCRQALAQLEDTT